MTQREEETPHRSCLVCGHGMGQLDRICDVCGSIRRPARAGGKRNPPERHSSCEICGEQIPSGQQHCVECSARLKKRAKSRKAEHQARESILSRMARWLKRLFSGG